MIRATIRDSSILDDPYSWLPSRAIDGTLLQHGLVNFMFTGINQKIENPEADLRPVFLTYEGENIYNDVRPGQSSIYRKSDYIK